MRPLPHLNYCLRDLKRCAACEHFLLFRKDYHGVLKSNDGNRYECDCGRSERPAPRKFNGNERWVAKNSREMLPDRHPYRINGRASWVLPS